METMNMSSPKLPPGFRFHPTDQELIIHYLKKKVSSSSNPVVSIIADVDIYKFNPWELPGKALFGESEWFFFSPRDRKYPNGARPNRAAASGYWKATGIDKPIISSSGAKCLGVKKTLAFYQGRPPKGVKTSWTMLEYRLIDDTLQSSRRLRGSMRLDDWVLCRVRQKSKTPQHIEEHYNVNDNISPFTSGYLLGQEIMNKNNTMQYSHYAQLQAYLLPPLEIEEANHEQGQIGSQTGSPEYPVSDFDSYSNMVSSNREALESIRKVLSIGALDELVPQLPTNASTCNKEDHGNNFQVSFPTTSASNPQCFPEFRI